jgi:hypothetical protein
MGSTQVNGIEVSPLDLVLKLEAATRISEPLLSGLYRQKALMRV